MDSPDTQAVWWQSTQALEAEGWLWPACLHGSRPALLMLKKGCFYKTWSDPINPLIVWWSSSCPSSLESQIIQRLTQTQALTRTEAGWKPLELPWGRLQLFSPPLQPCAGDASPGHEPASFDRAVSFTWSVLPQTYFLLPGKLLCIL